MSTNLLCASKDIGDRHTVPDARISPCNRESTASSQSRILSLRAANGFTGCVGAVPGKTRCHLVGEAIVTD